jgi:hypothetical protein
MWEKIRKMIGFLALVDVRNPFLIAVNQHHHALISRGYFRNRVDLWKTPKLHLFLDS